MISTLRNYVSLPLSPPASPPSPRARATASIQPVRVTPSIVRPVPKLASTSKAQMRKKGKRNNTTQKKSQDGSSLSSTDPPILDLDGSCCDHDHQLGSYPDRPPTPPHASCSSNCTRFDYTRIALTRENYQHISALLWALISTDMRAVMQSQASSGAFISEISAEGSSINSIEVDPNSSIAHALRHRYLHLAPPSGMSTRKDGKGSGLDHQELRFTTTHIGCQLRACAFKRASMFDKLLEAEYRSVSILVHVQPELVGKAPLRPFNVDLQLHVHTDEMTGSEYICAPELVRVFFPCFYSSVTKLMHSLYTLNHAFGRGSVCPVDGYGHDDPQAVLPLDSWKHWVGCPQALQSRKPCPEEKVTRIWLVDGAAEVSFGAECQPDETTIDPEISTGPGVVRLKGKGRA